MKPHKRVFFRPLSILKQKKSSVYWPNFQWRFWIQASAWPIIASGKDTIGIAQTGSGKTLAFSIPALAHLKHRLVQEKAGGAQKRRGPMMLILAPTRELAQQSQDVLEVAGKFSVSFFWYNRAD